MKTSIKKIFVLLALIFTTAFTLNFTTPTPVHAVADCRYFLGMQSWDCHVDLEAMNSTEEIQKGAIVIASNIFTDLSVIATYLVLGYVIYGGYLYMFAQGDPSKVAAGKKTLTHAFIGLAIVMLSTVILNTIRIALLSDNGSFAVDCTVAGNCIGTNASTNDLVVNLIDWVLSVSAIVAVVFVAIGGIGYVTSSGDAGKLQKAKNTIIYALIGLAIIGLAEIITAFVSSTIRDANSSPTETPLTLITNKGA